MALQRMYYGWIIASLSWLMLFAANVIGLTFGVFLVPISETLGVERGSASGAVALFMIVQGLVAPVIGLNIDRFGPRRVVLSGLTILVLAAVLMSRVSALWQLYLVFGIVVGIGYGCVTLITNSVIISRWFQRRRGTALGVSITGLPVGVLVASPFSAMLIERIGWESTYLVLAALVGLIVLPLVLLGMRDKPDAYPEDEFPQGSLPQSRAWSIREALPVADFQRICATYFACGFTMSMVQTHFPAHAIHAGMNHVVAATAFGMMGLWAIFGTVGTGALSDRYGRKILLALVYAVRMISLLLMAWAPSSAVVLLSGVLFGLSWTATGPLTSLITGERFGLKSMGLLFGTVYLAHQVGASLGAWLGGVVYDVAGNYEAALLLAAGVLAMASLLSTRISEARKRVGAGASAEA